MPSIYAMNREYEHLCILPVLIHKFDWKTHALGYRKRVDDEASTTTVHFAKCQCIFQIRRRLP